MLEIKDNVILAPFTTFHIGGPAKKFAAVMTPEELVEALRYSKENGLPVFFLGGGSNLLISDQGFNGLVVRTENTTIRCEGLNLIAGAGSRLLDAVNISAKQGLGGLELLAGIPGLVGGAVRGNAGAFGADIGARVSRVTAVNRQTLEMRDFSRDECEFGYRDSFFKRHSEWIIFVVTLVLEQGDRDLLERTIHETIAKREAKHSQGAWCAGSFFMNPVVTDEKLRHEFETETGVIPKDDKLPAGWLIGHVGLRGKQVGGALVSDQHPNYIVNTGDATAEDVIILASLIKQKVRTDLGIRLQEEIQMVGF